jgi:CRISPR-associated protein Csy3
MATETSSKITNLPSILAFERKLEVSDALMYAGNWGDNEETPDKAQKWEKIAITKRYNRSTQSSHGIKDDKKSQPNPVASENDDANLPTGKDTLKVSFSLRVIGDVGKPFTCNSPEFEKIIIEKVNAFKDSDGLKQLAYRYAYNLANGRFLWRNRVCAEKIQIDVAVNSQTEALIFDAHLFSLNTFDKNKDDKSLATLSDSIQNGLSGHDDFVFLKLNAYVKLGDSQHVFPSQEMNMGEKKKVLFQLENCAAIHNVKIGNALRTVDNWYENAQFPIAAEPFGAVTQRGEAFRKSKNDFYTLLLKWLNNDTASDEEKNFVIANLVRGGVFGESGKE